MKAQGVLAYRGKGEDLVEGRREGVDVSRSKKSRKERGMQWSKGESPG